MNSIIDYMVKNWVKPFAVFAITFGVLNMWTNLILLEKMSQIKSLPPCAVYTLEGTEIWRDSLTNSYDTLMYMVNGIFVNENQGNTFMKEQEKIFQENPMPFYEPIDIWFKKICYDEVEYPAHVTPGRELPE